MKDLDHYLPFPAEILQRRQDSSTIFTLQLRFCDSAMQTQYRFSPGQFNMVYLYGVGEVAVSLVSDPENTEQFAHSIRTIGRVTRGLAHLNVGDCIGIRGPYGKGWPVAMAQNKDIIIVTGGLGCAPVVGMIDYIMQRRQQFGRITILQGVKHSHDLIYQSRYDAWRQQPDTQVMIAADEIHGKWPWYLGHVTDLLAPISIDPDNTIAMMCGPEIMMQIALKTLLAKRIPAKHLFLSIERNMECAIGHCGHCQLGGRFVCKDGPIFNYTELQPWFGVPGF
ncbi:MAG: FAD/NAD(P)-binding protein [Coxiellaceae bacterium]|nr:MAG: FAD/NAD(P)-binding protein [Coxiellaceae bacterium]